MTIRRMHTVCLITKAAQARTQTHTEYVITTAFPRQQWLRTRASILRIYVQCLSLLKTTQNQLLESYYNNSNLHISNILNHGLNSKTWRFVRNRLMFWPQEMCCCCCCCRRRACAVLALPVKQLPPHFQCQKTPLI